ncbi:von Willebrand factor A domain-containing protein 8-like isoform X5 [Branchiostoma floridae x Branchiostoma belcheri]
MQTIFAGTRLTRVGMTSDNAVRRIRLLAGLINTGTTSVKPRFLCSDARVSIGDVSIPLRQPRNPELVPVKYANGALPQSTMRHLRWIMQKDALGQDVFLIGPPGPLRRALAMQYLEITKREVEYLALSRDSTETDLKQRREIRSGSAFYIDQCAVRAATEGRVLVLEGIEKAERNVLPVLNNLLENREMQLDDGRFLVAADRYDKLLQDHTKEELDAWKLVRVDERFRVIALGLPVPRYKGNPLDPPLRSRFQARDVNPIPFKDHLELLTEAAPNISSDKTSLMLSFATTMISQESSSLGLPDFPTDNLISAAKILSTLPEAPAQRLLHRLYPYDVILGKEGRTAVEDTLKKFELFDKDVERVSQKVLGVNRLPDESQAEVQMEINGNQYQLQVPAGSSPDVGLSASDFVNTPYHQNLLADMVQSHSVKDFCVIGAKGCGKSVVVRRFADMLGYEVEPIMLYQDMTARDLLQQRITLPNGDTAWRPSPLVTAALEGGIALLDGIHRVNPGTLAILQRLVHDRELTLHDGTRLLRQDRYEAVKTEHQITDEEMATRMIFPIHPSFRIVGLAEPPVVGSSTQQWLSAELLTMFMYHHMRPLSMAEEMAVVQGMVSNAPKAAVEPLLSLTHDLRDSGDHTVLSLSSSLSTRQLLRMSRRAAQFPQENLNEAVNKACLSRFLPKLARSALDKTLSDAGIQASSSQEKDIEKMLSCEVKDGQVRIGTTTAQVYNPENRMKVPDVLFYDNAQHLSIMEDMLKDFMLGEHLLLVGNQGVGKNKIVDRFLYLLNRPREYLQLHRDTTVQTLTLQPNVQDGVIVYEDSPLVRAVKLGHILVIDEADKAPTNVTCILKALVESGEMILADGRKIVSGKSIQAHPGKANIIAMHPDFRMIVLANRPGFPFLGNDFFGAMGDIFSCHAVDNPSPDSEMSMLRQYGPDVPEHILKRLVQAFGELRDMADQGLISYPYSTREVVNIVKHLEEFPNEGLASVVGNVFDFDSYNKEMQEVLVSTLQKHGIPIGARPDSVNLAKEFALPAPKLTSQWNIQTGGSSRRKLLCPVEEERHLKIRGPVTMPLYQFPMERMEDRSTEFSELVAHWYLPIHETNIIGDVAVTKGSKSDIVHVTTLNPISVYSMNTNGKTIRQIDLYDVFPGLRSWQPSVKVAALGGPLEGQVLLHEEKTNVVLLIDTVTGNLRRLFLTNVVENATRKVSSYFSEQEKYKMCSEFADENWVVFFQENGNKLDVVNVLDGTAYSVSVPLTIADVHLVSADHWLLTDADKNKKFLLTRPEEGSPVSQLHAINEEGEVVGQKAVLVQPAQVNAIGREGLSDSQLSAALDQKISSPNRIVGDEANYASIVIGFPELLSGNEVYTFPRKAEEENGDPTKQDPFFKGRPKPPNRETEILPNSGQVVRIVPHWKAPKELKGELGHLTHSFAGLLEVVDMGAKKVRYIPIPRAQSVSPYVSWLANMSDVNVVMATASHESLVTVDAGGCVRLWETGLANLERSLGEWRHMIGQQDGRPLQVTYERELGKKAESPKHGKLDPTGAPHVGGNTWAGGTGGRDTAGLGGIGGPYRLDGGHPVYQVPDWEKEQVPEEVKRAAREMAKKAFEERLREIKMSKYDAESYEKISGGVKRQVKSLRVILDSLQAKSKERQWLKHQTSGDLDEAKLIEGLTGEKAIYKRRGEQEPELGAPQEKPKRLRLVVDVSGSMYRFNGMDGRLERMMEAACMVMEAFEGYEQKFKFEIYGHSGDGYNIPVITEKKMPQNNKDRLDALKTMHAHSQFCMSGDHTLEATEHAISNIVKDEADEYFVIVLSDANLDRYGISPRLFSKALTADENVNAFALFIGTLGDQAERLTRSLPAGKAFVCLDTKNIPQVLQQMGEMTRNDWMIPSA